MKLDAKNLMPQLRLLLKPESFKDEITFDEMELLKKYSGNLYPYEDEITVDPNSIPVLDESEEEIPPEI